MDAQPRSHALNTTLLTFAPTELRIASLVFVLQVDNIAVYERAAAPLVHWAAQGGGAPPVDFMHPFDPC